MDESSDARRPYRFTLGERVRMRDGVHLSARIYRPSDSVPCPAIVNITPYAADLAHGKAPWYAERGYAYVLADSRGRGDSEGEANYGASESEDCVDLIEWVSSRPWCSGEVVMRGNSRHGHNQWLAAKYRPGHLKTIVPGASTFPGAMWPTVGNVFFAELVQYLALTSGRVPNWRLYEDDRFWNERYFELYRHHQPFSSLDEVVGAPSRRFKEILSHDCVDDWCDERSLTVEQAASIDIPVLSITGQYDDSILGTFAYYRIDAAGNLSFRSHLLARTLDLLDERLRKETLPEEEDWMAKLVVETVSADMQPNEDLFDAGPSPRG